MIDVLDKVMSLVADGTLKVDRAGRIWRVKSAGKPCAPRRAENEGGNGYLRVSIQVGNGTRCVMAHRVVWRHFRGSIPDGMQVNHKDLNKKNNNPDNLEIVTGSGNIRHSYTNGRTRPWSNSVEWRGKPRISQELVSKIRETRARGALLREVAASFGISITHAQRLCTVVAATDKEHRE